MPSHSSLYDPALAAFDFRTLLPGLWRAGESDKDVDEAEACETVKGSSGPAAQCAPTESWSPARRPAGQGNFASPPSSSSAAVRPRVAQVGAVGAGQGMARAKKRTNAAKKDKVTSSKKQHTAAAHARTVPEQRTTTSTGTSTAAASSPLVERADGSRSTAAANSPYPSVFFNDDLSAAPLYPPPLRRTPPRELPRVELEHSRRDPVGGVGGMSESPFSSLDELRIEHAYPESGMLIPMADDDERWDVYRNHSASHRMEWNDEEDGYADDDSDDFTSSSGYSADESPYSEDEERSSSTGQDEPRPFPNPRLKTQQKYIRPPEHDLEHPPAPRTDQQQQQQQYALHTPASYLLSNATYSPPTQAAVTAYSYVPSLPASALSHLSPYASPLMSPTATTPHEVRVEAVPSNLPSPTSEDAPHYHDAAAAAYHAHAAEVAGQYYAAPVYEDVRGRNPHPRLLWRSVIDRDALEILDAHHERVRGGPLPRLALAKAQSTEQLPSVPQPLDHEAHPVRFGASGIEREREHTGVGDDEMKERVRRARGRRNDPNRRTWSQAGRQWSRQIEKCGL